LGPEWIVTLTDQRLTSQQLSILKILPNTMRVNAPLLSWLIFRRRKHRGNGKFACLAVLTAERASVFLAAISDDVQRLGIPTR